jgi:hypothetical protein
MKRVLKPAAVGFLLAMQSWQSTHAQTLYQPRDIKRAFDRGTRAADGRPGPKYWQNRARYDITVQALPPARDIKGRETITYFNNSPDTLKSLVFRLIQNIHKPSAARDRDAAADYLTTGVQVDSFLVNGQALRQPAGGHRSGRGLAPAAAAPRLGAAERGLALPNFAGKRARRND